LAASKGRKADLPAVPASRSTFVNVRPGARDLPPIRNRRRIADVPLDPAPHACIQRLASRELLHRFAALLRYSSSLLGVRRVTDEGEFLGQ